MTSNAFGGFAFIADTSAWWRSSRSELQPEWSAALSEGRIATCPIVMMELLFSARDADSFAVLEQDLRTLRDVPITRSVTQAAIGAMRELAADRPGHHRVPASDALIAACARDAGIGVLHHDRHFDRLAEVMHFESRWVAARGLLS